MGIIIEVKEHDSGTRTVARARAPSGQILEHIADGPISPLAAKLLEAGADPDETVVIMRGRMVCYVPAPLRAWAPKPKQGDPDGMVCPACAPKKAVQRRRCRQRRGAPRCESLGSLRTRKRRIASLHTPQAPLDPAALAILQGLPVVFFHFAPVHFGHLAFRKAVAGLR